MCEPVGADPNILHVLRSLAMVDQCHLGSPVCIDVLNESAHLIEGLPRGLLLSLGYQSVVASVHRPSSILATCPAHRCFDVCIYSTGSLSSDLLSSSLEMLSSHCLAREIPMTCRFIALCAIQILSSVLFVKAHVSVA